MAEFYHELLLNGCLAQFNHPISTKFNSFNHFAPADHLMSICEIRNSPGSNWETAFIYALNNGWHLGAVANQDNHDATWGDGPPWTAVLTPKLTKVDIFDALRNHRTYATDDRNVKLKFRSGEHWMGESFSQSGNISFAIDVSDPDPWDYISRIEVFQNGNVIASELTDTTTLFWNPEITPPSGKQHFFVKVKQGDGDIIWSSPIWIECNTSLPSTPILCSPINSAILINPNPALVWKTSSNVESYTLEYSTAINFPIDETITVSNVTDTSYNFLNSLKDSTKYFWHVSAKNYLGTSTFSEVRNFRLNTNSLFANDKEEIRLTTDLSRDNSPFIFQTSSGPLWLFWASTRDGNFELYFKTSSDDGLN